MGTRGAWALAFLLALGNNHPSDKTVNLVAAWTKAEGTKARFNPLATTLDYGTNTKFNSVGVRNYSSRQEGIEATIRSLGPRNKAIRDALLADDPEAALKALYNAQWGTNVATVERYWRSTDVRGEDLLAEQGATAPQPPAGGNTEAGRSQEPPREQSGIKTSAASDGITVDQVRSALYIFLGATLIVLGGILIVIDQSKRELAGQAITAIGRGVATARAQKDAVIVPRKGAK